MRVSHGDGPHDDDDDARGWAGTKARAGSTSVDRQQVRATAVTAVIRRRPGRLLCLPIVADEPRGYEVEVEVSSELEM